MIGVADFAAACQAGDMQYVQQEKFNPGGMKRHVLADLRARNIWPME